MRQLPSSRRGPSRSLLRRVGWAWTELGFTWEHVAHYYLRLVLGDEGLFGASREQRARIADLIGV